MSEKFVYFIGDGAQITLPVTPKSYTWRQGKNIESVNISELGDVHLAGKPTRYSGKVSCMFPAREYPWLAPGASTDPYAYVSQFGRWSQMKTVVRMIIGQTDINAQVLIEEIQYSEKDGSGDVYADIAVREWIDLEAVTVTELDPATGMGGTQNSGQSGSQSGQSYTIVAGDTLSVLCRRFYGNGGSRYYNALASYNGIANPHLIYPGTVLTIPPAGELLGG